MTDFTEQEILWAIEAHECTREEAIATYAAEVRSYRELQRPILLMEQLRNTRDELIKNTDWWMMPDRTATDEQIAYRQALRDITDTYSSLDEVVWPTKPE
tara:strand:- start:240 stop:539 length:300 start_codon:yes stop_codon:yes gene_type:complete